MDTYLSVFEDMNWKDRPKFMTVVVQGTGEKRNREMG